MPAVFRRELSEAGVARVVVTVLDQCLAAYAPSEWARLEAQLNALPAFSRTVKALTRLLTSRAADCDFDVQGRILLPAHLRRAAGLGPEAIVVGVLNRFEVWAPDSWESFLRDSERMLEDVSLDVQWPVPPLPPPADAGPPRGVHPQRNPKR